MIFLRAVVFAFAVALLALGSLNALRGIMYESQRRSSPENGRITALGAAVMLGAGTALLTVAYAWPW